MYNYVFIAVLFLFLNCLYSLCMKLYSYLFTTCHGHYKYRYSGMPNISVRTLVLPSDIRDTTDILYLQLRAGCVSEWISGDSPVLFTTLRVADVNRCFYRCLDQNRNTCHALYKQKGRKRQWTPNTASSIWLYYCCSFHNTFNFVISYIKVTI